MFEKVCESTIFQPNPVRSSQDFQETFLWVSKDNTNKQINKQIKKLFCELNFPNQFTYSRNIQENFLWVSQDDSTYQR